MQLKISGMPIGKTIHSIHFHHRLCKCFWLTTITCKKVHLVSRNTKLAPQAALCDFLSKTLRAAHRRPVILTHWDISQLSNCREGIKHNEQLRFVHANLKHELYKTMLRGIQNQLLLTDCHTIRLLPAAGITLASWRSLCYCASASLPWQLSI